MAVVFGRITIMENKRKTFSLIILLSMMFCFSTVSHSNPTFVFGSVEGIIPLSYEEDDVIKGFYIDVFDEISIRSGFKVKYELYPFKRLNSYLQAGDIDGTLTIFYRKERESYLQYSVEPIVTSQIRVFVLKDHEFTLKSMKDLYGKKIGVIYGWTIDNPEYNDALKYGRFKVEGVKSYEQNLKKLLTFKIDCFMMTEQMTWFFAQRLGVEKQISMLDFYVDEVKSYIAVSKKSPHIKNPKAFLNSVDQAFNSIKADGTYDRLLNKYKIQNITH